MRAALLLLLLMFVMLTTFSYAQTAQAYLYERDSESWFHNGARLPPGGARLDGTKLTSDASAPAQRFNPSVMAPSAPLTNVQLFIMVPTRFEVRLAKAWTLQSKTTTVATYSTRLGDINPGTRVNALEALYIVVSDTMPFEIGYLIAAWELTTPVRGSFTVNR